MYPNMMNSGGGGYWNQQMMQGAQGMGGYQPQQQQAPQWMQSANQQLGQVANQQGRMGNMQDRFGRLQEQYKAAGSDQQAGIQQRMTGLQGRMDTLQGNMGDPNAEGADRAGMGWRQERRQAKNQGDYNPQQQMGGMAPPMMSPWGGWGGGWPQMQMGQQMGNAAQQQYNPQAAQAAPGQSTRGGYNSAATNLGSETMRGFFNSPFGQLTTASGGNSNVFKQQGGDENSLYHFDPSAGWKSMTGDEYKGYGDYNYADPSQYQNAGAMQQQFQRTNVPQNMLGRGFR